MPLLLVVLAGFLAAPVAPLLSRFGRQREAGWLLPLVPLAITIYLATLIGNVADGETVTASWDWVPALGVRLAFMVDGLSLTFALLIAGIGALVLLYAGAYMEGDPNTDRLYGWLLVFMGSMLGLVLADNVLTLFVFWELTSISSYLLIGFKHAEDESRDSALKALLITFAGGQAMLAGLILLAMTAGTSQISAINLGGAAIRADDLYLPILLLILAGALTKSAQVPFHFWLPAAMAAPTPVSAYLHSATMVKAGVYLLARLSPALGGTDSWFYLLSIVGALTMVVGAFLAFRQTDLKLILAYSTISVLGSLVMLLGIGTTIAVEAAVVTLVVHSFYKGGLFLVAGAIDHETGTRDIRDLSGLARTMPVVAAIAGLAALSLAGIPPFAGFLGKELLYEAVGESEELGVALTVAAMVAKALLVAVAGLVAILPFAGRPSQAARDAHDPPMRMIVAPGLLAVAGLATGLAPSLLSRPLISPASSSILGEPVSVKLALWHGFGTVLLLSAITVVAGALIYAGRRRMVAAAGTLEPLGTVGPSRIYDHALRGLNWLATTQTRLLQTGFLRHYQIAVLITLVTLVGTTLLWRANTIQLGDFDDLHVIEIGLSAMILIAALTAVLTNSRLGAVAALGIIGYSVALIYTIYGAPDLAMAQFLVETLTVILFVLVFYHLPGLAQLSPRKVVIRDAGIAVACGALVTGLVLAATSEQFSPSISTFFTSKTIEEAHSRNIVNAILTDYRALDSLGEITVLALAGAGVFALLKLRPAGTGSDEPPIASSSAVPSLILQASTRVLLPVLLLFSVFLLFRGHNDPGGGFTGGLVAAAAFALYAIAYDAESARRALRVEPHTLMGAGLLVAVASGLVGVLLGEPFLTAQWLSFDLVGFGHLELSTVLAFDIGIYLVVLGVTLVIILSLAEE